MSDSKDSPLDKAERLARQILERIGSTVDAKLTSGTEQSLKPHAISDLASQIEQAVEANLETDEHDVRRIAPNRFKVLFTYEETSILSPQYIEAVSKELTASVLEYVNNRRYVTRGPIRVDVGRDVLAKTTTVKASFSGDKDQSESSAKEPPGTRADGSIVSLSAEDGGNYRIVLQPQGAPAYIGRAAGNSVRINDPSVSRLHSSLALRKDGSVVIADLGSINGTCVNGQLLGRDDTRALNAGDVIGVGDVKLTVSEIA